MESHPLVGTEFGSFVIEGLIGRGGMGVVYRAEQRYPRRKVALKILSSELADDEVFRERFVREWTSAAIDHPNIVPIYQAGQREGRLYIAMRFVQGADLGALIRKHGVLEVGRAAWIVQQVAGALQAAHGRGLVHRDVKPANILVASGQGMEPKDHAYLSDFGLTQETLTRGSSTGQLVGTVEYMAPEQIEGEEVDARADIYSLGCVLYETLAGEPPYRRPNQIAVIHAHLTDPIPRLSTKRPEMGTDIDEVIAHALAKRPEERYASCTEFVEAVRAATGVEPPFAGASNPIRGSDHAPLLILEQAGRPAEPALATPAPAPTPVAVADGATAATRRRWRRLWPIAAGVVIVAVTLIVLAVRRPAQAPGADEASLPLKIPKMEFAFYSSRSGNMEIYTMFTDGSGLRNLTNNPAEDQGPAWSPDGSRIVFTSNRYGNADIFVMDADGSNLSRLTFDQANDVAPCWSPDGTHIAFQSERDGNREIYVMRSDGRGAIDLTNNPANDQGPAWSPDGRKIAFMSDREGENDIYLMNPDGSGAVNLTPIPGQDIGPSWSPDGTKIGFTSARSGNSEIWIMNADGSDPVRLTKTPGRENGARWSSDGNFVAFLSDRDGNRDLYIMKATGSVVVRLTDDPGDDLGPAFRPVPPPSPSSTSP